VRLPSQDNLIMRKPLKLLNWTKAKRVDMWGRKRMWLSSEGSFLDLN